MADRSVSMAGGRVLGFFTVLLVLTLNADNGRDLLDELVPWVAAHTAKVQQETANAAK